MKKAMVMVLLLGMVSGSQALYAAEGSDSRLSFWENLRMKIQVLVPQKKVIASTAVGGVRGAAIASDDVYWKGEKGTQTIDADELTAFQQAMALAEAGEVKQAQAAFSEFIKKNPDSHLRKDADQALAQLQPAK